MVFDKMAAIFLEVKMFETATQKSKSNDDVVVVTCPHLRHIAFGHENFEWSSPPHM